MTDDPASAAGGSNAAPTSDGSQATPAVKVVEAEIAPVIQNLPAPQQKQILHKIEESFSAVIASTVQGGPKLDPETVKILTQTVEKDNEYRFKYLSQREQHEADHRGAELQFRRERHRDHVTMLKPVLISVIGIVVVSIAAGLIFILNGREAVGLGILSSTATAVFGFLGGLGVSNFFKNK